MASSGGCMVEESPRGDTIIGVSNDSECVIKTVCETAICHGTSEESGI